MVFALYIIWTLSSSGFIGVPALSGKCSERPNLALHRPTVQSSTNANRFPASSDRAVDGITSGEFDRCRSCSSTAKGHSPWWMVDLGQEFLIQDVVIHNRDDYADRLHDFVIEVSSAQVDNLLKDPVLCFDHAGPQASGPASYRCYNGPILGRFVKITIHANAFLTLCEVEIYSPNNALPNVNGGLGCMDTFSLYRENATPTATPLRSTTTPSQTHCGVLCLQTSLCSSFTVRPISQSTWACQLYECKEWNGVNAESTRYFVQTFAMSSSDAV